MTKNLHAASSRTSPFTSNQEAAEYLKLSPRTLEKLRVVGDGPPFRKLGRRVVYALADLEEWAARRKCDSTSDPAWKSPRRSDRAYYPLEIVLPCPYRPGDVEPALQMCGSACGCGGIGRRSGLKIRLWQQIVGSSPTTRTSQATGAMIAQSRGRRLRGSLQRPPSPRFPLSFCGTGLAALVRHYPRYPSYPQVDSARRIEFGV